MWTVEGNSQYLVYAGEFVAVNGTAQQGIVRFSMSGGNAGAQPGNNGDNNGDNNGNDNGDNNDGKDKKNKDKKDKKNKKNQDGWDNQTTGTTRTVGTRTPATTTRVAVGGGGDHESRRVRPSSPTSG